MQLKTVDVFFHVHSLKEFSGINTTLTFGEEVLNVGNAFNTLKGIFTAPVSGIYTFVILSLKGSNNWKTLISLRVNKIEAASTFAPGSSPFGAMSIQSTLKLAAGDQVDMFYQYGDIRYWGTRFIGWLQQEESFIIERK